MRQTFENKEVIRMFQHVFGDGSSNAANKFFPERPLLLWQQNLEHNGLELGLRKRYIEDLCIRWGVFKMVYFGIIYKILQAIHLMLYKR